MKDNDLKQRFKDKLKAAGIHLLVSLVAFIIVLYLILFHWFAQPFFTAGGGWDGIQLMAAIDLVLGPMLTLIIYNAAKSNKEKIFDFTVIGIVQFGAMIWGGYTVYNERPIAMAYFEDAIYAITPDYIAQQQGTLPNLEPRNTILPLYYTEAPVDMAQKKIMLDLTAQQIPPFAQLQLLQPFAPNAHKVFKPTLTHPLLEAQLKQLRAQHETVYVVPLQAKYRLVALFFDQHGNVLDYKIFEPQP